MPSALDLPARTALPPLILVGESAALPAVETLFQQARLPVCGCVTVAAAEPVRAVRAVSAAAAGLDLPAGVRPAWVPCFETPGAFRTFLAAVRDESPGDVPALLHPAIGAAYLPLSLDGGILFSGYWSSGNTAQGVLIHRLWECAQPYRREGVLEIQARRLAGHHRDVVVGELEAAFSAAGLSKQRLQTHNALDQCRYYGFDGRHGVELGTLDSLHALANYYVPGHFTQAMLDGGVSLPLPAFKVLPVRHPLDIVCSMAAKTTIELDRSGLRVDRERLRQARLKTPGWFEEQCRCVHAFLRPMVEADGVWKQVCFERFQASPQAWLRDVVDWLGMEMTDAAAHELWCSVQGRSLREDWPSHYAPAEAERWRRCLSPQQVDCARAAGLEEVARRCGYPAFDAGHCPGDAPDDDPEARSWLDRVDLPRRRKTFAVGNRSLVLEYEGGPPCPALETQFDRPEAWNWVGLLDPAFQPAGAAAWESVSL